MPVARTTRSASASTIRPASTSSTRSTSAPRCPCLTVATFPFTNLTPAASALGSISSFRPDARRSM